MIELTIPGVPIAKKRPRFFRKGNFVGTYNEQRTEEGRFLFEVQKQFHAMEPVEIPIDLNLIFYMPIPRGTSKKKLKQIQDREIEHTKKPDCDNLLKFVKDCLNGVIWKDDSQVFRVTMEKVYSETPKTVIQIWRDRQRLPDVREV